jgi:hypothetical protein
MGKNEPTHEIKLGRIRAAIWANTSEKHNVWFNVTVSRLYKDNGDWKDTSSFGRDDLPMVNKAIDMAYGWILRRERKLEQSRRNGNRDGA